MAAALGGPNLPFGLGAMAGDFCFGLGATGGGFLSEYQPALKSPYLINAINTMNRLDMCEIKIYLCPSDCFSSQVFYEEGASLAALVYGSSQPVLKSLFEGHHV